MCLDYNITTAHINSLTAGYGHLAIDRLEQGWTPYLVVFKFKQLSGSRQVVAAQMEAEAERIYTRVVTRTWRRPLSPANHDRRPVWILVPDWPVAKHKKVSLRSIIPNNGLHLQGIAMMPPGSRLREGLDEHFAAAEEQYCPPTGALSSIFAGPITHDLDYVHAYNFKALMHRRASFDDVIILPRTLSELQSKPRRAAKPWRHPVFVRD